MTDERIAQHYGRDEPIDRIRSQLTAAGHDLDDLHPDVLAGVDEFHLGGRLATMSLVESMQVTDESRVLDVGCGIGGAARTIARRHGCEVMGVDLTPVFVETARQLTSLVGMDVRFEVADATDLPFGDDSFEAVTMVHVGMNIADKELLFAELSRVLRPGGFLHVYDIMRVGDGELEWPLPWSTDESTSFVVGPEGYVDAMRSAGLATGDPIDRIELVREAIARARAQPPSVDLSHLMGPDWPEMFAHLSTALQAGVLRPIEIEARETTDA